MVIHAVKGFGIVNKAEIDVFLKLSCFFNDSAYVGNLISGSSAFSKTSLNIWKFMVHVLPKPVEQITGSVHFAWYPSGVYLFVLFQFPVTSQILERGLEI